MINLSDLKNEVIKLALEYPDAIYKDVNGCYYGTGLVINGPETEGCLIGQGICRLDEEVFEEITSIYNGESFNSLIRSFKNYFLIDDEENKRWLIDTQTKQDEGLTWKKAVDYANAQLRITSMKL